MSDAPPPPPHHEEELDPQGKKKNLTAADKKAYKDDKKAEKEARKAAAIAKAAGASPAAAAPAAVAATAPAIPEPIPASSRSADDVDGEGDELDPQGKKKNVTAADKKAYKDDKKAEKEARKAAAIAKAASAAASAAPTSVSSPAAPDDEKETDDAEDLDPQGHKKNLTPADKKAHKDEKKAEKEARKAAAAAKASAVAAAAPGKDAALPTSNPPAPSSLPPSGSAVRSSAPAAASGGPFASATATPPLTSSRTQLPPAPPKLDVSDIHPRVVETGLLMRSMRIVGGNARSLALIDALYAFVASVPQLQTAQRLLPQEKDAFVALLSRQFSFIDSCRKSCVGMLYVKSTLEEQLRLKDFNRVEGSRRSPRDWLLHELDKTKDEILGASLDIVERAGRGTIRKGDVILTYGRSSTVEALLRSAIAEVQFSVIVVDSAPLFEGRGLATRLQASGVPTNYVLLSSICMSIPKCTKVIVGASAVLLNGDVYSRAGTAAVLLTASTHKKPVLCIAESYKFTMKVWLGSLTVNEICRTQQEDTDTGGTAAASSNSSEAGYLYDLAPANCIDMFVSEYGMHHPFTIASITRDRQQRRDAQLREAHVSSPLSSHS